MSNDVIGKEAWVHCVPWIDQEGADIEAYVDGLTIQPNYDLEQYLRSWQENGLVIFEGAVSSDIIDRYLEDIDALRKNFEEYEIPIEVRGNQISSRNLDSFPEDMAGVKLNQMQCFSRAAARLSLTPLVMDFLSHVFRDAASVCQSLTFWRGSEQPIHIDYPYVRQQAKLSHLAASWIPLEDISPNSGPLAYFPGGHKIENSGFFDWGGGSIIYDEQSSQTPMQFADYLYSMMDRAGIQRSDFCPKRGDVLIWHGNLPHEGTKARDPALTRKSYVTHYTAESMLPDWMRHQNEVGTPIGNFENGGYCYRYPWFEGKRCLPSWDI